MKLCRLAILLLTVLSAVWCASVPFSYECSKESGFLMDPNTHNRFGYITDFAGLGVTLQRDFQVSMPLKPTYPQLVVTPVANGTSVQTAKVTGVIEKFQWNGGPGDPVTIQFYVSQQNAALLRGVTGSTMKSTAVSSIGWWIGDYDSAVAAWFEEAEPASPSTLKATAPAVTVDMTPVVVKSGIDVNVYKVSMTVAPQAHQVSTLFFATSSKKTATKTWGQP